MLASACGASSSSTGSGASSGSGAKAPSAISIGTLYSGSGSFATSSLPEYAGLKFWISHENSKGGAYVAAFHKRIPLKLVSYNDQSSPSTAATLYAQLITQNKVNIMVADFGSVLTAPAVTIAQEHHQLLFDQSGSGTTFFSPTNPYIVLCDLPTSAVWPDPLIKFLGAKHISKVAILYDSNDFDASQATTIKNGLAKAGVKPVFYQAVPTSTSSYGTLVQRIAAAHPSAVLELGYPNNDIAFLQALKSSGAHFPMVFTAFPGQLHHLLESNVGASGLAYTYSYGFPPQLGYNTVTTGLGTTAFEKAFAPSNPTSVNFLDIAGYNTGLVIEAALAHAKSLSQLALRKAVASVSGKMTTIEGPFKINSQGAQVGEPLPVSQLFPSGGTTKIQIVYPSSKATHAATYPAP